MMIRPSLLLIVLHSMVAALPVVAALMMQYIVFQHRLPWGRATAISARICGGAGDRNRADTAPPARSSPVTLRHVGAGGTGGGGGACGWALLRWMPRSPRGHWLRRSAAWTTGRSPWRFCGFHARPNMVSISIAIRRLSRYEAGDVPAGEHLLITPEGWQKNIAKWTPGRRVTYLGSFAEQGMDYYWVAGKGSN